MDLLYQLVLNKGHCSIKRWSMYIIFNGLNFMCLSTKMMRKNIRYNAIFFFFIMWLCCTCHGRTHCLTSSFIQYLCILTKSKLKSFFLLFNVYSSLLNICLGKKDEGGNFFHAINVLVTELCFWLSPQDGKSY